MEEGARWDIFVEKKESVRALLAQLLGGIADDVCVTTSASEAMNSLMSSMQFEGKRNRIVATEFDFPTTSQIMLAQAQKGAEIVRARCDDSGTLIPLSEFEQLIDERTALVTLPLVCYRNGVLMDVAPIIELAQAAGARVLIDGYQAMGSMPFDAPASGADFVVGGCTKYLLGGSGTGFMWIRDAQTQPLSPTATGWFAQANPHAMDILHHQPHTSARRFESGTPNAPGLFGAEAGLELVLAMGLEQISARINQVTDAIKQVVAELGWQLVTPLDRHGAMLAIRSTNAPLLVERLTARDVILTERDGNIRVAPHFYNNLIDVGRLTAALEAEADLLA